jgi:demethylmenaquinone methyltransferase/2-methoxy-6-polyprenyl-1,4-benzoquinol methylase
MKIIEPAVLEKAALLVRSKMDQTDFETRNYYRERAPIYDRVYSYPERQADLRFLEKYIPQQLSGLDVLEVAAGTGYWSQFIEREANSILATDATVEALNQIGYRKLSRPVVTKAIDAYSLHQLRQKFTGAFAGLWFSHVPRQRRDEFFLSLNCCLKRGASVVLLDNSEAQCNRLPFAYTDGYGNTFQSRELSQGSSHNVIKNFPTEEELLEATRVFGSDRKYIKLDNFWVFQYKFV